MYYTIDQIVEEHLLIWQSRFKSASLKRISFPARRDLRSNRLLFDLYDISAHLRKPLEHITINALQAISGLNKNLHTIAREWSPEYGTITYRTRDLADSTILDIEDEGGGINPDIIRQAAQQQGIIPPNDNKKILDLIFLPFFSTKLSRSDGGRGQGLYKACSDLKQGWQIYVSGTAYRSEKETITIGEYDKNKPGTIIRVEFPICR